MQENDGRKPTQYLVLMLCNLLLHGGQCLQCRVAQLFCKGLFHYLTVQNGSININVTLNILTVF